MIAVVFGLLACLLLASDGQTANHGNNRLLDMQARLSPLSRVQFIATRAEARS